MIYVLLSSIVLFTTFMGFAIVYYSNLVGFEYDFEYKLNIN